MREQTREVQGTGKITKWIAPFPIGSMVVTIKGDSELIVHQVDEKVRRLIYGVIDG